MGSSMSMPAEAAAAPRRRPYTVAVVSTHCSLRNWAEKRLYEPLALNGWNVELVFWDRSDLRGPEGEREAEELGLGLREFPNRGWSVPVLVREYWPWIFRELDKIRREDRLDAVI